MVVVSNHLSYALWIQVAILTAKWIALVILASRGAIGAALAYLISEIVVSLVPAAIFCQRAAGVWLDWRVTVRSLACATFVVVAVRWAGWEASLAMGAAAVATFLALAFVVGAFPVRGFRQFFATVAAGRGEP